MADESEDQDRESGGGHLWLRRSALTRLGWLGLGACSLAGAGALLRLGYPRAGFEAPSVFKAGFPEEYREGEVSARWVSSQRVWIVREQDELFALYASCTHLGCTPRWMAAETKFKCFCHGSGFDRGGINFEGPAPRPLERVKVSRAEDGQLLVDVSVRFRYERDEWKRPGASLKV